MDMVTRTDNGRSHETKSIRLYDEGSAITYKQLKCPVILTGHSGRWTFARNGDGCSVSSEHKVVINPDMIASLLGQNSTLVDARAYVRNTLGENSRTTLGAIESA